MASDLMRHSLVFPEPRKVEIQREPLERPEVGQVLVRTQLSAISAGTELLVYRGEIPEDVPLETRLPALSGPADYPLRYGYAAVGEVIETGRDVADEWLGQSVFAFQPHTSHFVSRPEELLRLPPDLPPEDAVFLPNVETAVNFVHDGAPLLGEAVAVIGQGVVGLITTAILAQLPLSILATFDLLQSRRESSLAAGAHVSLDPETPGLERQLDDLLGSSELSERADLCFELSGALSGLNLAIQVTGFAGRIVLGSWYGTKPGSVNLGGKFHRSRIRMVSSQVSSVNPELAGRWTKARRLALALDQLSLLRPSRFISHRLPLTHAIDAYRMLDEAAGEALGVVIDYDGPAA